MCPARRGALGPAFCPLHTCALWTLVWLRGVGAAPQVSAPQHRLCCFYPSPWAFSSLISDPLRISFSLHLAQLYIWGGRKGAGLLSLTLLWIPGGRKLPGGVLAPSASSPAPGRVLPVCSWSVSGVCGRTSYSVGVGLFSLSPAGRLYLCPYVIFNRNSTWKTAEFLCGCA